VNTSFNEGTSVIVQNLFQTLPVRYNEFKRNIKREFAKAVDMVQAYALISSSTRILCTNIVGKG